MKELFRYTVREGRESILCDDGRWYCHDEDEPPKLWGIATVAEAAMAAEIQRLRAELRDRDTKGA